MRKWGEGTKRNSLNLPDFPQRQRRQRLHTDFVQGEMLEERRASCGTHKKALSARNDQLMTLSCTTRGTHWVCTSGALTGLKTAPSPYFQAANVLSSSMCTVLCLQLTRSKAENNPSLHGQGAFTGTTTGCLCSHPHPLSHHCDLPGTLQAHGGHSHKHVYLNKWMPKNEAEMSLV